MTRELYVRTSHPVRIILGDDSPSPPSPLPPPPRRVKAPPGRARLVRRIRKWMREHDVPLFIEGLYALAEVGLDTLDAQSKESPKA